MIWGGSLFFDVSVKDPWVGIVFHDFDVLYGGRGGKGGGPRELFSNALPRIDQTGEGLYSSTSSCPMAFLEDHRKISLVAPRRLGTYLNSFS